MTHSAMKTMLAVTIMTTFVALSEPIEWGSFEDIVQVKHGDYPDYGGVSREYVSASINFRDFEAQECGVFHSV